MSWEMEIYGKRIYLYHDKPGLKRYGQDRICNGCGKPYEYEIYATYETSGKLEDKKLHKMIDNLNPDLRISKNREFFILSPEDAYELLESIATISGTKDKLKKVKTVPAKKQKTKRPPVNFFKCNIPVGAELVFSDDPSVVAVVVDERKVQYG